MRKAQWLFAAAIYIFSSRGLAAKFTGGSDVGGGQVVVCRNPDHSIGSVELLDLWEARKIFKRKVVLTNDDVLTQVGRALDQLKYAVSYRGPFDTEARVGGSDALRRELWEGAIFIYAGPRAKRLRGVNLRLTNDAYEVATPQGCEIEQIVRYTEIYGGASVLVNQDLMDHLDKTNTAALLLHEAFYAFLRGDGIQPGLPGTEPSSIRVRRAIGLAFSGYKFTPLWTILPDDFYVCSGKENHLLVYHDRIPEPPGGSETWVRIIPDFVGGRYRIGFEPPSSGHGANSVEEFFLSKWGESGDLGHRVGFDFSYEFLIGGDLGKQASVGLTSAADQKGPFAKELIKCWPEHKNTYFPAVDAR